MQLRSTSTQRTYRYVRLGLVGVVLVIAVAVTAQMIAAGPLGSVSAAYYTPARNAFVGGLCAVAFALLVLSGRSLEQVLLDLAAVLAPVIAFVPTPVTAADVPGAGLTCPGEAPCVPGQALPEVASGMLTWAVASGILLAGALVLAAVQRTLTRAWVAAWAAAALLVVAGSLWWVLAPDGFLRSAHLVATAAFFAVFAAVAALAALRPTGGRRPALRAAYVAVALGILTSLAFLVALSVRPGPPVLFLVGESAALVLFAVFWLLQTAEVWDDPDPTLRVRRE